jgi:predicted NBD/HSP70 family sugar kinase
MNAIGVDVGGTKIAAAVVSAEGEILSEVRYSTLAVPPDRLVDSLSRAITILLRGAQGAGGELGHVTLDPTGPRCGNHGCLEALASGTAIRRRAREVANERPNSALGRLAVEREALGEHVLGPSRRVRVV